MVATRTTLFVLLCASLLSLVLGSVHAFSVFLEPLEQLFSASRSTVSMSYSLALVALTIAVLVGHKLFSVVRPSLFVLFVCLVAAAGSLVAAAATSISVVWLGYGLLFGAANGLGYAFGLQISAQVSPGREGLAMGIVTASYAFGASISPPLFTWAVSTGGFQLAMWGLTFALLLISPICSSLLEVSGVRFQSNEESTTSKAVPGRRLVWLWLGYGAGVAAGLMAIGHATGIAKSAGLQNHLWTAPVIIAVFNMMGSFIGGWLADRLRQNALLAGLPLLSALALLFLTFNAGAMVTLAGLGVVGLAYGATIAAYPASISKMFGGPLGTRIYGRVFTAWGTAGLLAPWFAGFLFDETGGYAVALAVAAGLGICSAGAVLRFYQSQPGNVD